MKVLAAVALIACAVSLVFARLLARGISNLGLVDHPSERKRQIGPVPLVGGLALLPAIGAATLAAFLWDPWIAWDLAREDDLRLALLPVGGFLVGILDDATGKRMSAIVKSIATLLLLVAATPFDGWGGGQIAWCALAFVSLHSMNTIDHANGIAGLVTAVSGAALAWGTAIGFLRYEPHTPIFAAATAGAASGFLFLNFPRARVYLGDSGTLLLGGALAALLLEWRRPELLLLAAVPLADLASVSWLRVRAGAKPWIGDRRHVTHRLMANGMSETRAVLVVAAAQAVCSAAAAVALVRNVAPETGWSLALGVIGALALGMLCVRSK